MNVFVIHAGSSSLKFQVIATDLERIRQDNDEFLCRGQVERIGGEAIFSVIVNWHWRPNSAEDIGICQRRRHGSDPPRPYRRATRLHPTGVTLAGFF